MPKAMKLAADCIPCPDGCGEPWCPDCRVHYADCSCAGPFPLDDLPPVKKCKTCKKEKHLTEFHSAGSGEARRAVCKLCRNAAIKANPGTPESKLRRKAYLSSPTFLKRHREKEHRRKWVAEGILTDEQYTLFLAKSSGLCDICKRPETKKRGKTLRRLALDHDHVSNAARGWLCQDCNVMLGLSGDDPERLRAAAEYLLKHRR